MAAALIEEPTKKDCMKNTGGLKKCFTALVDRKQVNLDIEVLKLMLKKELQINLDVLEDRLAAVMPFMLVMYMKTWPGWQRSKEYFSGKLNFKEWYEKFRQYIVVRLNYLIKNGFNNALLEMQQEKTKEQDNPSKNYVEHGTQTDNLAPKGFAPFTISIDCPPSVLNSLVFTDSGDDVIIKQHPEIPWTKIDTKQLIHWPQVEVEFFGPELSFKRRNCIEYCRWINFVNNPLTYEKSNYIEEVEIIDRQINRHCYTLNLLRCYAEEYVKVLRSIRGVDTKLVNDIEVILNEFLMDIEEFEMNNTMASNTSVLFNIGKCTYLRNKKISKGNYFKTGANTELGYCETIVPKMQTSLIFFKGVQNMKTTEVSFSYLNMIKDLIKNKTSVFSVNKAIPTVVYRCTFCSLKFSNEGILKHLQEKHQMEHNVLCIRCKKSYSVHYLSNLRWKHICNCVTNTSYQNKQTPIVTKNQ